MNGIINISFPAITRPFKSISIHGLGVDEDGDTYVCGHNDTPTIWRVVVQNDDMTTALADFAKESQAESFINLIYSIIAFNKLRNY